MLSGTISLGGQDWDVREEKRGGPQSLLFTLTSINSPTSGMQVRLGSGQGVGSLEEVELWAADPAIRWFVDKNGLRWESRIVVHSEPDGPDVQLVKFISEANEVREGAYTFADGLGRRSDAELTELLESVK